MPHSIKKILTAAVSLVCVAAFTFLAVAWFAGFTHHGTVDFRPGSNPDLPDTMMWMYYSQNDGAAADAEEWETQNVGKDTSGANEYLTIPAVQKNPADGTTNVTYTMSTLHFGKVDNLVTLNDDNKVYFRFYIDKSVLANPAEGILKGVTFTLKYNTSGYNYSTTAPSIFDSFYLYKTDGTGLNATSSLVDLKQPVTGTTNRHILEYQETNPAAMQFLQMRYAVSTTAYGDPTQFFAETNGKKNLTFSQVYPINCGSGGAMRTDLTTTPICTDCQANTCGVMHIATLGSHLTPVDENDLSQGYQIGDGFYVYVEIAPLLDAFGMQENILEYFVPAYMLFDVKLDIEIK